MLFKEKSIWWIGVLVAFLFTFLTVAISTKSSNAARELAYLMARESAEKEAFEIKKVLNDALNSSIVVGETMAEFKKQHIENSLPDTLITKLLKDRSYLLSAWSKWSNREETILFYPRLENEFGFFRGYPGITKTEEAERNPDYQEFVIKSKSELITDPYQLKLNKQSFFVVSSIVPVLENNKLLGITGVDFRVEVLQEILSKIKVLGGGHATLLNNNGVFIGHPDFTFIGKKMDQLPYEPKSRLAVLKGELYSTTAKSVYLQKDVYRVYIPIFIGRKLKPWSLAINIPLEVIEAPSEEIRRYTIISSVISAMLIMVLVTVFVKKWREEILERKNFESLQKQTLSELESLVKSPSNVDIFAIDHAFKYRFFNQRHSDDMQSWFGKTPVIGASLMDTMTDLELQKRALETYNKVLNGKSIYFILEYKGSFLEQLCNPIKTSDGKVTGMTSYIIDITDHEQAKQKMENSENRFRQLFERNRDALLYLSMKGTIKDFNRVFIQLTGETQKNLSGKPIWEFTPEGWKKWLKSLVLKQLLSRGYSDIFEKEVTRKDGTSIIVEFRAYLIKDGSQKPTGYWCLIRDITDQKLQENELKNYQEKLEVLVEQRTEELEKQKSEIERQKEALVASIKEKEKIQSKLAESEKMASIGVLTAGIAHEINNPINFMSNNIDPLKADIEELKAVLLPFVSDTAQKGFSKELMVHYQNEIAKKDTSFLFEEIENLLKGIKEGAFRTQKIVEGLRTFSRIDDNDFRPTDLNKGLEATLTLLQNSIRDRIQLMKNFGNIPPVECLSGKINQVFMNILTNAIQAIEESGTIFIQTKLVEKQVEIIIRDSGKGMDEETQRHIFEPFYTTKEVGKGTGLGLSITFSIIQKHHGTIDVESKPGLGTSFIIRLPLAQPEK